MYFVQTCYVSCSIKARPAGVFSPYRDPRKLLAFMPHKRKHLYRCLVPLCDLYSTLATLQISDQLLAFQKYDSAMHAHALRNHCCVQA